jgi:hypothetical protein
MSKVRGPKSGEGREGLTSIPDIVVDVAEGIKDGIEAVRRDNS